jgi:antitoxin ParD1/3/4
MATTSVTLGEDLEAFIRDEVASGRYGSAREVIEDGLRALEERKRRVEALRAYLAAAPIIELAGRA